MGIEGIMTKLERMTLFINFLTLDKTLDIATAERTQMRLKKWQQSLRKSRKGLQAHRLDDFTENPPDSTAIKALLTSRNILETFLSIGKKAKSGGCIPPSDINLYGSYIFALFVYLNGQRPAAVANLTLADAEAAKLIDTGHDTKLVVRCSAHKTARAYGAAKLSLD